MPRSGFSIAQIMPDSTATVTCRLVALLCGTSARASSIDNCEPNQYAPCVTGEQHAEFVDADTMSSIRIRLRDCSCQLRPANSCTDSTAASQG
jgi:hypothetical protein